MSRKKVLVGLLVIVVGGAAIAARIWSQRSDSPDVTVETVQHRDLEALVSASGKIQPKLSVDISATTMGQVTEVAVAEGQQVEAGQFLLQIDARTLQSAVERTQAAVEAAESGLQSARVAVETAQANLDRAKRDFARQQNLWERGLTTREAFEQAENNVVIRETELKAREQEAATRELQIKQERANLDNTRYELTKVRHESPIDGLVTRRNIDEGETVVVGTMNNAGTVLLTIADMSVIQAEVEVDETDIPSVFIGQQATIVIDALPNVTFKGHVTEIGNSPIQAAQGSATQATNFKVVVVLDGEIPEGLRPGFTCTADITTAVRQAALAVPIQAVTVRELEYDAYGALVPEQRGLQARDDLDEAVDAPLPPGHTRVETEGVFVLRNGTAVFAAVELGIVGERYFELLSGLQPGEVVITGPFASVREIADGDPVRVESAEANGVMQ